MELLINYRLDRCMEAKRRLVLKEHLSCIKLNWNSTLESKKYGMSLSVLRRGMPRTKHCRQSSKIKIGSLVLHSCEVCADVKTMMQQKCARRPQQQKCGHRSSLIRLSATSRMR
uniref:Uncharacterized protein n=1 Tax=Hyaloperonospora arabidopsidis (strain Emoy2) TaxID=559515 RepID=M4BI85_HYAAE